MTTLDETRFDNQNRIKINDEALKEGNNYFATNVSDNNNNKGYEMRGYRISKELEEILDRTPKTNDPTKCNYTERIGTDTDHYFVSKYHQYKSPSPRTKFETPLTTWVSVQSNLSQYIG